MAPNLVTLIPGDQQITANWENDPSLNIHNAFLFVLNKNTKTMYKINLTEEEAYAQTFVIDSETLGAPVINGNVYMVQYIQQQMTPTGDIFASDTMSAIPAGIPNTPILSIVNVVAGGVKVQVQYTGNNGSPYTSVEFQIADVSNNEYTQQDFNFPGDAVIPDSNSTKEYTIGDLTNGIPYDIACYVYNSSGSCEQISNTITLNPSTDPNAPDNLLALSGEDAQVTLSFANSTQPVGVTIEYWIVKRALSTTGTPAYSELTQISYVPNPTSPASTHKYTYVDTTAVNGVGYMYVVSGVSVSGVEGSDSSPVKALPFKPVEIGSFNVTAGDEQALAVWTPDYFGATFAPPAQSITTLYYDLEIATDASFSEGDNLFDAYYDLSYNILQKLITGLTNGESYNFRVRAKSTIPLVRRTDVQAPGEVAEQANLNGFAVGAWVAIYDDVPASAPDAPTNLSSLVDSHMAQLVWLAPENDGGANILSYNVYQYSSELDASLNINASLAANVLLVENATITGLDNNVNYWFRVSAINRVGEGSLSDFIGPVTPFDNVDPAVLFVATQIDASLSRVDISLNWTSPAPLEGIQITGFQLSSVSPTGVMTDVAFVSWDDWDSSNANASRNYVYFVRLSPAPETPGYSWSLQTVAVNPNYPPGSPTIRSTYIYANLLIKRPPSIAQTSPTVEWDPVAEVSTFKFNINTYDIPVLGAVLYAPPLSDELNLPTPIHQGEIGGIYDNENYVFTVDYQVATGATKSYFVMFATAGGSTVKQLNI